MIPSAKLFLGVVQNQWVSPGTGPLPSTLDKRLYNVGPELSKALEVPSIDLPVVSLSSPNAASAAPEDALCPEDKRLEQTLIKGHQASAWAVRAATSASFFSRSALLWLRQLQERLSPRGSRARRDINKLKVALEYTADASLDVDRFASKSIASSITTRRLLWLKQWQADNRAKWRLAFSAYSTNLLFGPPLEPLLVESKDKRKVLQAATKKQEGWHQPFYRRQPFQGQDRGFSNSRPQCQAPPRQGTSFYSRSGRNEQQFPPRKSFRDNSNRSFKRQK